MEPDHIRASDADRDRVAERLREALAEGRLTHEEHEERLDAVYRAKTVGELAPITADLPSASERNGASDSGAMSVASSLSSEAARRLAAESTGQENIVAVLSGTERKGRWLVEPRTNVSSLLGTVELDFREAVLAQREVSVQCAVFLGTLEIIVPHGVRVVNNTTAVLGTSEITGTDAVTDPNAPTIRLSGTCILGTIEVKAKGPRGSWFKRRK
ncbi:hypothetical protein HNR23_004203 [Nocardiopsis mwathae]|uniref:Cell wall-active antibiotics response LiaF-like C-terminal domain-containing protein n=1 Tax=Nocardiopsis mwathae TaxID=1472723 RepID=A0A7W9YL35_9ACTN|nr:DUF1707 domain-containing protein [Nocardiopsis mwathae]MBB6174143.1 hypothetical protein [Nocardiopsis mwathae]